MGGQHYRTATAGCSKAAVLRLWAYPLPASANQRGPSDTREQAAGAEDLCRGKRAPAWRRHGARPAIRPFDGRTTAALRGQFLR
jgi:hypothetical protein